MRIALTATPSAPFLSPAADPAAGGHRGGLGDPDELEGQVAVGCLVGGGQAGRRAGWRLDMAGSYVGRGRLGRRRPRSRWPSPSPRPRRPARAPSWAADAGVTSAIRPRAASRCTRTADPCGATDVTGRATGCGPSPLGSPAVSVTAAGLKQALTSPAGRWCVVTRRGAVGQPHRRTAAEAAQHVEPDQPGDVVGARALARPPRACPPGRPGRRRARATRLASGHRVERVVGDQHGDAVVSPRGAGAARARSAIATPTSRDGERLVEQQQPGLGGQRPGDRDPLGLAAGELRRAGGRRGRSTPRRSSQARAASSAVRAADAAAARAERDVAERGQVREEQVLLEDHPDAAVPGVEPPVPASSQVSPSQTTRPSSSGCDAGQRAQQRGLAGAVGADDRDHVARLGASRVTSRACRAGARRRARRARRAGAHAPHRALHGRVEPALAQQRQHRDRHEHQDHAEHERGVRVASAARRRSRSASCGWCPGSCRRR